MLDSALRITRGCDFRSEQKIQTGSHLLQQRPLRHVLARAQQTDRAIVFAESNILAGEEGLNAVLEVVRQRDFRDRRIDCIPASAAGRCRESRVRRPDSPPGWNRPRSNCCRRPLKFAGSGTFRAGYSRRKMLPEASASPFLRPANVSKAAAIVPALRLSELLLAFVSPFAFAPLRGRAAIERIYAGLGAFHARCELLRGGIAASRIFDRRCRSVSSPLPLLCHSSA